MLLTGGEKRLRERWPWDHCSFSLPPSSSSLLPEEAHSGGMGLKWRKLWFADFSTVPDFLIWVLIGILTTGPQATWKWTARPSPIFLLQQVPFPTCSWFSAFMLPSAQPHSLFPVHPEFTNKSISLARLKTNNYCLESTCSNTKP